MNRLSGRLPPACAQWSVAISSAVVVAPAITSASSKSRQTPDEEKAQGHFKAQLPQVGCNGRPQARVIPHQSHAPENARRFRSVDAIERANDRLANRVTKRIGAKPAQRAEDHRVVLVPEHKPFLCAEVAIDGRGRHAAALATSSIVTASKPRTSKSPIAVSCTCRIVSSFLSCRRPPAGGPIVTLTFI